MSEIGVISYSMGAGFFLVLTVLLLTSWRGRLRGGLLVLATAVSAVWSGLLAYQAATHALPVDLIWSVEILRDVCWFLFMFRLLAVAGGEGRKTLFSSRASEYLVYFGAFVLLICSVAFQEIENSKLANIIDITFLNTGYVILALVGLVLVEQLYRNTRPEQRWALKFLFLGILGIFAFDFLLYSDSLMFGRIDPNIWYARGAINAFMVPLIGVAASRNPEWSVSVFISRRLAFHTTTLIGAGGYMLVMAAAGYYISYYGGTWGPVIQVVFLFSAIALLLLLVLSGQLRARIRVFLNKHFFSYKYDYREEWLRLIGALSSSQGGSPLYERVIHLVADIVESPGGALWVRRESGQFIPEGRWGITEFPTENILTNSRLADYLKQTQWVVDIDEYRNDSAAYDNLEMPGTILNMPKSWLLVPMFHGEELMAILVLVQPRAPFDLNWENIDLLKTVGRQSAGYLALNNAAEELSEARQFEAFNRFSAFVIHDLKTLIAQLSLVASNAQRHKHNPEFMEDAIETVRHSVNKMNKLMRQLRGAVPGANSDRIELASLIEGVLADKGRQQPIPQLVSTEKGLFVKADRDRLSSVIGHIVQNAQDATPKDGFVKVQLRSEGDQAIVEVHDNGTGMDASFIKERLFRPFDSTKGLTGMGIGAHESRELVRALGGDIRVNSVPGAGSRFLVYLPITSEVAVHKDTIPNDEVTT